MIIRKIEKTDNQQIGNLIQMVLIEMGAPKVGTAYADPNLFLLFETYNVPNAIYYVLENENKIVGGVGISQLLNSDKKTCELQKMYFLPEARGFGFASKMVAFCLEKAKEFGFEHCYLETMPYMQDAQKLYLKHGFEYLEKPLGDTGHYSCPVWMLKNL